MFCGLNVSALNAHRFHSSLTRIDYDAENKNVEITIQLIAHDVAEVFERRHGKALDMEKSEEFDAALKKYLAEHFVVRTASNAENLEMKWVGKEFDNDRLYVYMEIPSEKSPENFEIKNTIFFETYEKQTNIIVARFDGEKADLLFKKGDDFKKIKK